MVTSLVIVNVDNKKKHEKDGKTEKNIVIIVSILTEYIITAESMGL